MDNIVVADKSSSTLSAQPWGNVQLGQPGVVQMPIPPGQVASVARNGQDLILTLKSGEQLTISNFFTVNAQDIGSDLVFQGDDGVLWQAQYDANAFNGFTFSEVSSLDTLIASTGVVSGATQTFAFAGLGVLGAGGAAAAASSAAGGGGSSGSGSAVPFAPSNLALSIDGQTLTGTGTPGSTVNVRDPSGNLLGSAPVGADGNFSIGLNPPLTNGEQVVVDQTDPAGNASEQAPVSAPDTTAPDAPADLQASADGQSVTGTGEPGATVSVRDANGTALGSAVVGDDGTFSVALNSAQPPGTQLSVEQTDQAGNTSAPATVLISDPAAPAQPSGLALSADGLVLSGSGQVGATVSVRAADGSLLGSAVVGADGRFSVPLANAQLDGQTLSVQQTDADGRVSLPASLTAADVTAPAAPGNLQLAADGTSLSGTGEPGATVNVRAANGSLLGSALVASDGTFTVTFSTAQSSTAGLSVSQTDAAGNTSPIASTPPSGSAIAAPTDLAVSPDGLTLTGRGVPGAQLTVRGAGGQVLGNTLVNADGSFSVTLNSAQLDGQALSVSQSDSQGRTSPSTSLSAPDVTPPQAATGLQFDDTRSSLSGRAEPGATVKVLAADGSLLGSAVAAADGRFTISFATPLSTGEVLGINVTDQAQNSSATDPLIVPDPADVTPPAVPKALAISSDGGLLTGRGEAGAQVRVLDAQGNSVGTAVVGLDGQFSVELRPAQLAGQQLEVTLTDSAGNVSANSPIQAPTAPQQPQALSEVSVAADGLSVTGKGLAGLRVFVRSAAGRTLGSSLIGPDGTFTVALAPAQLSGESLNVVAVDSAGNSTVNEVVQAPDTDAPPVVSDLLVSPDGSVISGRGQPGAAVTVRDEQGNVVASGVVADNGTFILDLDSPVAEGVVLSVTQTDASGLPSAPIEVQVPDASGPVAVQDVSLDASGREVSGSGVPGTQVEVRDANGNVLGSGPVGADGTFQIPLSGPQINGERLDVVVIDASGAESIPTPLQADDSTAPAQPTDLAINPNGLLLSGNGEPGAQVTVRDAQGVVLGTAVVGETGSFSVPLSSAQTQGQALQVILTDAQGNASTPLGVNAPNSLGDLQPANLSLDGSGLQLSGTGQAGSTVSVRDSDGTPLGTAQVGADGRFTVTLAAVQNNGQTLQVVASAGGQTSAATALLVPDTQPPAAVTGLDLSADRTKVTGNGEAGATVIVRGANGVELGRDTVQPGGTFSVGLSPVPAADQPLSVVQIDPAGNASLPAEISPVDTTPPDPVSNVVISANGSQVSGNGEAGARVQIFDAQDNLLGAGLVGSNGRFEVSLSPAQVNGQLLSIVQTDAASNASPPFALNAPDIQPPAPPGDVSLASNGLTLSGSGVANASISVRDATGTLIGSGTVGPDGRFSFDLNTAQLDGERLQVVQSTTTLSSAPTWVTAADVTAPDPVSNLLINASGNQLTGLGEAGATVTVRSPGNLILGTAQVAADGSFSVSLNPPQVGGQSLSVVQTDASANASTGESISAPNLTPPVAPGGLALDDTGQILTGQTQGGAVVQVFAADGSLIVDGIANADGSFSLDLGTPRTNGEQLLVQASVDGRSSPFAPYTAADTTPPEALANLLVSPDGLQVSGTGEAGTLVDISVDGVARGTANVGPDGMFIFTLPVAAGQGSEISLVARDLAGNTLPAVTLAGPDGAGIATPTALVLSADGTQLSGQATAGTTITVTDDRGGVLGSVGPVGADGLFSVTLDPPQTNGQTLAVVAEAANGQVSVPGTLSAADTSAPLAPVSLVLSGDGTQLSGRGEPGARLSVKNAAGVELGSLTIDASGLFMAALAPAQIDGQVLSVTLTDAAGNVSQPVSLTAPDLLPPAAPTEVTINLAGTLVSGQGEPGTQVEVLDAQGTLLARSVVLPAGTFEVTLPAAQLTGAPLQVQLRDGADNLSPVVNLATLDRTPPAPVTATDISLDGSQLTGQGEAGARVEVRSANGTLLGSALVAANGAFAVNLVPASANGETLAVIQVDAAGNASAAVAVLADDITAPEALSNVVINRDGLTVTGNGEPGATVFVRAADGSELGRALVAANGSFSVTLSSAQINAQVLTVNQEDPPGNEGPSQQVIAPDLVAPLAPADLALNPSGLQLSGTAEAGSAITVRDGAGQVIGSGVVAADGTFLLNLNQAQLNGQVLRVTAQDAAGNVSLAALYTATDVTAPLAVTALAVTPDGSVLSGLGEPGAQVQVRSADGSLLGSASVGAGGRFNVNLAPAAQAGSLLEVLQSDAAGNVSPAASVTTPGNQAPAVPADLQLSADGLVLSGTGSAGSTVTVRGSGGVILGSALVIGDGSFSVSLASAQLNGERLEVSAQSDGLSSLPAELIATDSTAPLPLAEYRLATDGVTLEGRGEPLATVQVLGAGGQILASVQVGADGRFSTTLSSAQQAGQVLSLTQTDLAGNVSPAVSLTAPDLVAPLAAANLQLDGTGLVLSGTGEVGATVRVVDANGGLLGSGVVLADSSFQVTLSQAPVDGQALAVTLTDAAGNVSLPATLTPVDTTPPLPLSNLEISIDGLTIVGRGERGATVVVRAADGSELGTTTVADNGAFSVTLDSAQTNAQLLSLTQSDRAGNLSPAVSLTAPDTTPPVALQDPVINPLGTLVTGSGEPGATVRVTNTNGVLLGSAVVLADGSYSVTLQPAQIDLQVLRVNQVDAAGNPGPVSTLTAPDLTPPAAAQELALNAAGTQLSGRGEVNADVMVLRADGTSAGNATVGADGRFSVSLAPGSADGGVLQVILMDAAQNMSVPAPFTTPDLLPPAAVSDLQFDVAGQLLVGNGEPNATVEVFDGSTRVGSAPVGADGRFSLDLGTLTLQGQALTVVQRDAAGNQSSATALQVPDLSVPAAPTDLALAGDGLTLTGTGLPGATVQVYGPDDGLLGTVTVGGGGAFSLTLTEAQLNGELLQVRQISSAGVTSADAPLQALDVTPPAPVTALLLSADGLTLSGRGEAGASVRASVGGTVLGSVEVAADGSFQVPLNSPQLNGEVLSVIQTDQSNNPSSAVTLSAPDLTPPVAPTLTPMTVESLLQGTAEVGSTVTVRAQDGTLLGSGTATDGTFSITLTPPQNTGALLSVVATDAAGNVSPVASIPALDTTPPDAILASSLAFSDDLSQVSGLGEAGATVRVTRADGTGLGESRVAANGTFTLTFTGAVVQGEALRVIQTDAAGNDSSLTSFAAPTVLPPSAPLNLVLNAEGTLLSGQASVGTTVTVRAQDGTSLGSATTQPDGTFSVSLQPAQTNGQLLSVSASTASAGESIPALLTAGDSTPPAPLANLQLEPGGTRVTGTGEAGAKVTISNALGTELGSATVSASGTFSVTLSSPQLNGQLLSAVQADAAGNLSPVQPLQAPDLTAPLAAASLQLNATGTLLSGIGEAGASVRVVNASGVELGTGTVGAGGTFSINLNSAQTNGQTLTVTLTDAASNTSLPATLVAADTTEPLAPTNLAVNAAGLQLTGNGEPGARVFVTSASGAPLGNALVASDGSFSVLLSSAQLNFESLRVSQTDPAGNVSVVATVNAPDITPPAIATALSVSGAGTSLSGRGEVGASVTVRGTANQVLGTGVVGADGQFSVSLSPAQNDGQLLTVQLSDARTNLSPIASVTAPDTTPPVAPATAQINAAGTLVTGTGIAGDRIVVRDASGTQLGTAQVALNGSWSVVLSPAQVSGQALQVTQVDLAGNVSTALPLITPDLTPPAAASGLQLSADGLTLSGNAEVGATVTVKSATGTTLGTATVGVGGGFSVNLNAAQINGEVLSISVADRAGNLSPVVTLTAPDIDADRPVVANDNLATATVNLAAVTTRTNSTESIPVLLGVGLNHTVNFTVANGTTATPTLTLLDGGLLSLGTQATFTLQVKDASGAWVTLGNAGNGGLLNLSVLAGSGVQVRAGTLLAGEYRLTLATNSLSVATTINSNLQLDINSLTQFTGSAGTAITGNVVTDPGPTGSVDITGPDNAAVVRIQNGNAGYVSAGSGTVVQGLYGALTIDAQGNYSYRPSGAASSVGKVDVFNYQLVHPNGLSDPAVLYVRIDSPQAAEVWSDTNLAAPALLLDAVNDSAATRISLGNLVTTETSTLGSASTVLSAINGAYTFSVANNTVSDLKVLLSASNLLSLLGNTTVELYKLNASNQYVLVKSVSGGTLLNLGNGQYGLSIDDQTAGTYRVNLRVTGVSLLNTVTVSLVNTATYTNQQVVTGYTPVSGNLLTDTSGGAPDTLGSALTVLSVMTAANTFTTPGYNGTLLTGTYGTLLVKADGSYTYTLKPGLGSAVVGNSDTFTYQLTHPNGSSDTATLTVALNAQGSASARMALASADDDGSLALAGGAEVLSGTDDADVLDGSQGGAVTLLGGAGDDTLIVSDLDFARVDGGSGTDTLLWAGGDAAIDLSLLQGRLSNIEVIDLNDASSVQLTLGLADLVAVTEPGQSTLLIRGGEQDSVLIEGRWLSDGTQLADGLQFTQYTPEEDPTRHLWVQAGIQVV
ncbi:BapA/Bap/LapF family large adhesin [uncultured Pseudomonas sp.]|uniref:BapA/Bap/LapF family large adhesin n=1 Tax=uncultured Pseudomonas sp. TaxID=114707 RepID=UPI0025DB7DF7|nr:BapA/Bap/LapF family large adhesin [uncultured Pseudomonas sp.]